LECGGYAAAFIRRSKRCGARPLALPRWKAVASPPHSKTRFSARRAARARRDLANDLAPDSARIVYSFFLPVARLRPIRCLSTRVSHLACLHDDPMTGNVRRDDRLAQLASIHSPQRKPITRAC
jgi:hypothetical protein